MARASVCSAENASRRRRSPRYNCPIGKSDAVSHLIPVRGPSFFDRPFAAAVSSIDSAPARAAEQQVVPVYMQTTVLYILERGEKVASTDRRYRTSDLQRCKEGTRFRDTAGVRGIRARGDLSASEPLCLSVIRRSAARRRAWPLQECNHLAVFRKRRLFLRPDIPRRLPIPIQPGERDSVRRAPLNGGGLFVAHLFCAARCERGVTTPSLVGVCGRPSALRLASRRST